MAALAEGTTEIHDCLLADDVRCTLRAVSELGLLTHMESDGRVRIEGQGLFGLEAPPAPLNLGNSGTSMRLLLGLLAGQHFSSELHGDASLSRRPMDRVMVPLKKMGATMMGMKNPKTPPLFVQGARLKSLQYEMPVASAQVKSAILLAGLYADGLTCIEESVPTRDHTERMLTLFGAELHRETNRICVRGPAHLEARSLRVMGDPSSAAFPLVAALVTSGSRLTIQQVNLNPHRIGFVDVLKRMGAGVHVTHQGEESGEPYGEIASETSQLKGVDIGPEEIPSVIDELPILMVAAAYANGRTRIRGAEELRVKETDRIHSMAAGLAAMHVKVEEAEDGLVIEGGSRLSGASIKSFGDHRTAMSFAVAALGASGSSQILDTNCVTTSFPSFWSIMKGACSGS